MAKPALVNGSAAQVATEEIPQGGAPLVAPPPPSINITFKKSTPVNIEIDPDALTWADICEFNAERESLKDGRISDSDMLDYVNGLLTKLAGQDVTQLPGRVVSLLNQQLASIVNDQGEAAKN